MKPGWTWSLRPRKAVEDAGHDLAAERNGVGARQQGTQPNQSSAYLGRRAAGSWSVKWCGCRLKVFELEYDGQHYCRCGYPIKRYSIYDMSPTAQALWPIAVVLALIGLLYALTAPAMHWEGKRPICDDIVLACPKGG